MSEKNHPWERTDRSALAIKVAKENAAVACDTSALHFIMKESLLVHTPEGYSLCFGRNWTAQEVGGQLAQGESQALKTGTAEYNKHVTTSRSNVYEILVTDAYAKSLIKDHNFARDRIVEATSVEKAAFQIGKKLSEMASAARGRAR